jgi:vacuolar-type H+-ATPase catalytic subunit A/Vma1
MDIVELGRLTSVALTYQNYLQELNAENIALAPGNTRRVPDTTFQEMLQASKLDAASVADWASELRAHTRDIPSDGSLEEISLDIQTAAAEYNKIAEAYGRALAIYQVALGRR